MAKLSITDAWNETAAFVAREGRLIFPIGFLMLSLPGAVLQILMPPPPAPGELPEGGLWLAYIPVMIVISLIGTLAITLLALRGGTSVGEALAHGARRVGPVILALLLVGLASGLASLPIMMLFGLLAINSGNPALAGLAILVMLPLALALWARLSMVTPVAAAEQAGPIAMLQRSWQITRGHFWKLLGLMVLLAIVAIAISIAVGAIGGLLIALVAGMPEPGSLSFYLLLILSALVQAVLSTVLAVLLARVYAQLAGTGSAEVFA